MSWNLSGIQYKDTLGSNGLTLDLMHEIALSGKNIANG